MATKTPEQKVREAIIQSCTNLWGPDAISAANLLAEVIASDDHPIGVPKDEILKGINGAISYLQFWAKHVKENQYVLFYPIKDLSWTFENAETPQMTEWRDKQVTLEPISSALVAKKAATVKTFYAPDFVMPTHGIVLGNEEVPSFFVRDSVYCSLENVITANSSFVLDLGFVLDIAIAVADALWQMELVGVHYQVSPKTVLFVYDEKQNRLRTKLWLDGQLLGDVAKVDVSKEGLRYMSWLAPEVLHHNTNTDAAAQAFSLGNLLWELVEGNGHWIHRDIADVTGLVNAISSGKHPKISKSCPDDLAKLIKKCWSMKPDDRPSLNKLVSQLVKCKERLSADKKKILIFELPAIPHTKCLV